MKSIPQYSEEPACKNDYLCLTAIFHSHGLHVQEGPERSGAAPGDEEAPAPGLAHCFIFDSIIHNQGKTQ